MRLLLPLLILLITGCATNKPYQSARETASQIGQSSKIIQEVGKDVRKTGSTPNDSRIITIVHEASKQEGQIQILNREIDTKEGELIKVTHQYQESLSEISRLNERIKEKDREIKSLKKRKIWLPYGLAFLGWTSFIVTLAGTLRR